jgi:cis-3-alkyl-4-acyloxetan-2-one decarboxylase
MIDLIPPTPPLITSEPPDMPRWLVDAMPYRRRCATVEGVRLHFVDAGEGPVVVLVHGNPTWSFLWRDIIRHLLRQGYRVIAPDLMGFGLSDKPSRIAAHSVTRHVRLITRLVKGLVGDAPVLMVGQDWGGPIAAGVGSHLGDQLSGLVFGNTAVLPPRRPLRPTMFHRFSQLPILSDLAFRGMNFPVPALAAAQGDARSIGSLETFAYTWPFLLPWRRTGPLALARMVPDREGHPSLDELDRIGGWVQSWRGPMGLIWGMRDPILGRAFRRHRDAFPQALAIETPAGHFLQEEVPELFAELIHETAQHA